MRKATPQNEAEARRKNNDSRSHRAGVEGEKEMTVEVPCAACLSARLAGCPVRSSFVYCAGSPCVVRQNGPSVQTSGIWRVWHRSGRGERALGHVPDENGEPWNEAVRCRRCPSRWKVAALGTARATRSIRVHLNSCGRKSVRRPSLGTERISSSLSHSADHHVSNWVGVVRFEEPCGSAERLVRGSRPDIDYGREQGPQV